METARRWAFSYTNTVQRAIVKTHIVKISEEDAISLIIHETSLLRLKKLHARLTILSNRSLNLKRHNFRAAKNEKKGPEKYKVLLYTFNEGIATLKVAIPSFQRIG